MKTAEEIVQYIESFYQNSLDRPQFYFRNVEAMEAELWEFERLYDFIVDDSRGFAGIPSHLVNFMFDKGYGSLGFAGGKVCDDDGEPIDRPPMQGPDDAELARMHDLAKLWREYLANRNRLSHDGG